ncbi:MAG: HAD-IIB family hydrolase [Candidatus Marinimicrobia bacterium]|nr:HAD-IIB family hydrolase [Candidatus Neomarinimicrobiota bacterium]
MSADNNIKYVVLLSIHGLIRGHNLELGRDADTGGQTKYVVDLAKALGKYSQVEQVDLITRTIVDEAVSADYAQAVETLSENARIVRISAGPDEYIPKEQLWDHLDMFYDNLTKWLNEQDRMPDLIHSHYADAGYVGAQLANLLGVPLIHTGHSLGRDKRKRLLASGLSSAEIESTYNMDRRIDAEEETLANADMVITSTANEIEEQYGLYNYYNPSRMNVIPPGTDLSLFHPPSGDEDLSFADQLPNFLADTSKPLILALSRPDERKNILTLVEAFGESRWLQEHANLLIVAGSRDDIRDMDKGPRTVLTNIMYLIDVYNLYGKVAMPKSHSADEVPKIYRYVTASGGVFVNPALTEPFGLTLLEAAASGLPLVATENGGPVDIIENCKNGELVDPLDRAEISTVLKKILADKEIWSQYAESGIQKVKEYYSWEAHVNTYEDKISGLSAKHETLPTSTPARARHYRDRALVSDIDQALLGNQEAIDQFSEMLKANRKNITFCIATGRRIDTALAHMKKYGIPRPDILISSLGTRIHYGNNLDEDLFWTDRIDHQWSGSRIRRVLDEIDGLELQPKVAQSEFKLSYYYDAEIAPATEDLISMLRKKDIAANVILSFGQFLDIVPLRASKGQALRYVSQRLDIPLNRMLVTGGSGADEDMMRGDTLAVVLKNRHDEELSQLVDLEKVYFASQPHAAGILEAIEHYNFYNL